MRKKLRLGLLGLASVISLAACADVTRANQPSTNTNKDSNTKVVQSTTNQLSNNFYRALITNGKYEVSQKRGATLSLNTRVKLKELWNRIDWPFKKRVPNEPILLQRRANHRCGTTAKWIARKSDKNPDGLNPADNWRLHLQQDVRQFYFSADSRTRLHDSNGKQLWIRWN